MAKAAGNSDSLDLQPPRPPPTLPYSCGPAIRRLSVRYHGDTYPLYP
jgi:hypothetical protein